MASVLAIAPLTTPADSLERLEQELASHDVIRLSSAADALAHIDASVPDLVVFPLTLARREMKPVVARLRQLSGEDKAQWRLFDAIAAAPAPDDTRWFYWFRPKAAAPPPPPKPAEGARLSGLLSRGRAAVQSTARGVAGALATVRGLRDPLVRWAPRVAVVGVLVAAGVAAPKLWPMLRPMLGASREVAQIEVDRVPAAEERPLAAPQRLGRLFVTSDPPGATVVLNGKDRGVTPLTIGTLPAGSHAVTLRSDAGTVRRTVVVKANETTTWEASIYSGWVAVYSPFELEVSEEGRRLRLDEQSQALLPPGRHALRLVNTDLGFSETRTIDVLPGEVAAITIAGRKTKLTVLGTPGAQAWVDGTHVGETPLLEVPVDVGTHDVVLQHPQYGERRLTVTATAAPVRVDVDLSKEP